MQCLNNTRRGPAPRRSPRRGRAQCIGAARRRKNRKCGQMRRIVFSAFRGFGGRKRSGRLGAALFFQRGAAAPEVVDGACGVPGEGNGRPSVSDFKGEAFPRRHAAQEIFYDDGRVGPYPMFFLYPKPVLFHSRTLIEAIANPDQRIRMKLSLACLQKKGERSLSAAM